MKSGSVEPTSSMDVAIVGMAARLPHAPTIEDFWHNLLNGLDCIDRFSLEELLHREVHPSLLRRPEYVPARGVILEYDAFDAPFFGYSPREAELMDPQHRVFLECAWTALEDAGCDPKRYPGAIGVYASVSRNTYLQGALEANRTLLDPSELLQTVISNEKDFLASRVAYRLDLRGPAITVQTACSSSLVAVHLACQALLSGDADMVLTGGASIPVPHQVGYLYETQSILAPDGTCRAFDARAKGTVPGSGVAAVVLQRLEDAIVEHRPIYAVIRGTAVNNDGASKVGFTAPSVDGQARVLEAAARAAGISPDSITYVEAHGTGTTLGDPIEYAALRRAIPPRRPGAPRCGVGSVKSNIGHLDAVAGVAGLVKTTLCLMHRRLVPTLHFESLNPNIDSGDSSLYVVQTSSQWDAGDLPLRAGVSSFGMGGTNAHVILEEPPPPAPRTPTPEPPYLLVLSAQDATALDTVVDNLVERLRAPEAPSLPDVAYTTQVGRRELAHRRAVVVYEVEDAIAALEAQSGPRAKAGVASDRPPRLSFMFPGQGVQHLDMGRGLYEAYAVYRATIDRCASILKPLNGIDIRSLLYPDARGDIATRAITDTAIAQPTLFVVEYALAELLRTWGVHPTAMVGHSIGQYVAACVAGVFTLDEALRIVVERGRVMQRMPEGIMLAVAATVAEMSDISSLGMAIAAVNARGMTVLGGSHDAGERAEAVLRSRGFDVQRLRTSHAFHTPMMEPAAEEFTQFMRQLTLASPKIPLACNVTGDWLSDADASNPEYWGRQMLYPVQFAAGLDTIQREGPTIFVEVGPGQGLSMLVRADSANTPSRAVPTMRHAQRETADAEVLLGALGELWVQGARVEWESVMSGAGSALVRLPTYPFQRKRYWILPTPEDGNAADKVTTDATTSNTTRCLNLPPRGSAADVSSSTRFEDDSENADVRRVVAQIWCELLGVPNVALEDDFFTLGGHSLTGTRLIARLRDALGIDVPLALLFEASTLGAMSDALVARGAVVLDALLERLAEMPHADAVALINGEQAGTSSPGNTIN